MTPLHNAIKYRHTDVAEVLLQAGAELSNDELHLAILDGNKSKDVVRLLIDAGQMWKKKKKKCKMPFRIVVVGMLKVLFTRSLVI